MADQMKPTPRSTILGLFSDVVNLPLEYMSSPERTQQMQGAAQFLYGTGIPKTLERMSYGDSLFTGSGMTLRPREETINAAMTVAPFAPVAGRVAGRAVRATEGLLVGMSIKDVGKEFPTSITNSNEVKNVAENFANQFRQMGFDVTLDHSGSKAGASSYLKIFDPQTGRFLNKSIRISDHSKGAKQLDANINVLNPQKDFLEITSVLNEMRAKGETLVIKRDKYAQELINNGVKPKTAYQRAQTEITENQFSPYPQQAALDLAQQRPGLLDMTRTPSEAEIKKMSRNDLIQWLQNNDPDGQYLDPTPNPSVSMYRTGRGYAVENADSGDVFEFKDFNEAQDEFNSMRFSNAEFPPMTLQDAQESAINYLREFAQPADAGQVLNFTDPFGNTIGSSIR